MNYNAVSAETALTVASEGRRRGAIWPPKTITFLLAAATSISVHNDSGLAETQPCRSMQYERNPYTICEVDLRKQMLRLSPSFGSNYAGAVPRSPDLLSAIGAVRSTSSHAASAPRRRAQHSQHFSQAPAARCPTNRNR